MKQKYKLGLVIALVGLLIVAVGYYLSRDYTDVLKPQGMIADRQKDLIITSSLLMLIIVIPVFILTFTIAWRYRVSNTKARYTPEIDGGRYLELTWWAIPSAIILVLAILAWRSSHQLDPFRPIASAKEPINIEVVALQWKWLFIYPEQNIASVNQVQFPARTPINFYITADAPMNSFWIPSLGGQIYAMAGMVTQLHLTAANTGTFNGSSANISGKGFSGMRFSAISVSDSDFNKWVISVKKSPSQLDLSTYNKLANPSENTPVSFYSSPEPHLQHQIVMKFMGPASFKDVHHH